MSNITPIRTRATGLGAAERPLTQARAIIDLLYGAAGHGAIEPPSNGESLAQTLGVVMDLLDEVHHALWPADREAAEIVSDEEVPRYNQSAEEPNFVDAATGRIMSELCKAWHCPFCASTADINLVMTDKLTAYAECGNCGAEAGHTGSDGAEDSPATRMQMFTTASELWNTRKEVGP